MKGPHLNSQANIHPCVWFAFLFDPLILLCKSKTHMKQKNLSEVDSIIHHITRGDFLWAIILTL